MPKLQFTPQELKGYFKENVHHRFYDESIDLAERIKIHSDGKFPEKLIHERRPNEPTEVLEYRKKIFVPKTKPTFSKVVSSLSKIRRSSDWNIDYPEEADRFSKIVEEETLQVYCDEKFPLGFTSMTNWTFQVLLKKYLEDPNALIFTFPLEVNIEENQYLRPFPVIFDSCHVLEYKYEDFAVLINPKGSTYLVKDKQEQGESYYIVTTERIQKHDQINGEGDIAVVLDYEHGLGFLPVFRIGAIVAKADGNTYLHESRVAAMLPELDEAVREYSDLQAAVVTQVYPERWEFTQNECNTCKGTGRRRNPRWFEGCADEIAYEIDCDNKNCNNGYIVAGPYSKILIRPTNNATEGMTSIPTPPVGEVKKDTEIVKVMIENIERHINDALAAINFEFLAQSPLNQSGTAKEVDKDELNNTVHSIAEDLVRVMDNVYKVIAITRYRELYSVDDIVEFMLPNITVPEKYDILSSSHLEQELTTAKTNKANPVILNALEIEYASKKFNTDPTVGDELMLILKLDPLPNISEDEKMSRLSNKGITQETYVISSNIHEFVQQALDENPDFAQLPLKEQKAKMREFAKQQIEAQDSARKIVDDTLNNSGIDPLTGEPMMENGVEANGNGNGVFQQEGGLNKTIP